MSQVLTIGDITTDGQPDGFGVRWTCQRFDWGSPGGTLQVAQRQQDHGGWGGSSFLKPRVITAAGRLVAPDQSTARDAVDRLCVAVSLDATTLIVSEAGIQRQATVRRDDEVLPTWETDRIVSWSIQLIAEDPRRYSTELITRSTGLPSSAGGLTWPVTRTELNTNSTFETDIAGWSGANGATLSQSTAHARSGTHSLAITPSGSAASPAAFASEVAVSPGEQLSFSIWIWSTAAFTWQGGVQWNNAAHGFVAQSVTTVAVPAGAWTLIGGPGVAPAGAAGAQMVVKAAGTPAGTNVAYVDDAQLIRISGGLTWPIAWPATVTSGVVGVDNLGNMPTRPRFVITGPCSDPQITLVGSSQVLAWDLDLDAGQFLDVDVDRRTSLINGQVSRSGAMTSRGWFDLPPGRSDIAFNASAFVADATLSVVVRSAWM